MGGVAAEGSGATGRPPVFARDATGLVREFGLISTIAIIMSAVIGGGIHYFAFAFYVDFPGADILLALVLGALWMLTTSICLAVLNTSMPRAGGPYVYVSRIVSPFWGFMASWTTYISLAIVIGLIAFIDVYAWGISFWTIGQSFGSAGLKSIGTTLFNNTNAELAGGFFLVLVVGGLAFLGVNIYGKFLQVIWVVPVIGSITMIAILASTNSSLVPARWDAFFGAGAYNEVTTIASPANGYSLSAFQTFKAQPTIFAFVVLLFAYEAYYSSSYAGGEIKNPRRNLYLGTFIAMFAIAAYYIALPLMVFHSVGFQFATQFVFAANTGKFVINPTFRVYASIFAAAMAGNPYLASFIAIIVSLWILNDLPPFFLVTSRSSFAWAFDRFFPAPFADVNERFHSPHYSIALVMVIALVAVYTSSPASGFGTIFTFTITVLLDLPIYLFVAIAAMMLPFARKDIYEKGNQPTLGGGATAALVVLGIIFIIFASLIQYSTGAALYARWGIAALAFILMVIVVLADRRMRGTSTGTKLPVVMLAGIAAFFINVYALLATAYIMGCETYSNCAGLSSGLSLEQAFGLIGDEIFWVALFFMIGAAVFVYYYWKNSQTGIDAKMIYSEIPPE